MKDDETYTRGTGAVFILVALFLFLITYKDVLTNSSDQIVALVGAFFGFFGIGGAFWPNSAVGKLAAFFGENIYNNYMKQNEPKGSTKKEVNIHQHFHDSNVANIVDSENVKNSMGNKPKPQTTKKKTSPPKIKTNSPKTKK